MHYPSLPDISGSGVSSAVRSELITMSQGAPEAIAVKRAPAGLPRWALHPSEAEPGTTAQKLSEKVQNSSDITSSASIVSLIQTAAVTIHSSSPLFTTMPAPPTLPQHQSTSTHKLSAAHKHSWEAPAKSKHGIVNKPVTFHNRIKSSGYGGTVKRSTSAPTPAPSRIRMYPSHCTGKFSLQPQNRFPSNGSEGNPFVGICYNIDGSQVALRSNHSSVLTLRTPIAKYRGDGMVDFRYIFVIVI